jgi:hypothetical protein
MIQPCADSAGQWRLAQCPHRKSSPARSTRYDARTAGPHRSHVWFISGLPAFGCAAPRQPNSQSRPLRIAALLVAYGPAWPPRPRPAPSDQASQRAHPAPHRPRYSEGWRPSRTPRRAAAQHTAAAPAADINHPGWRAGRALLTSPTACQPSNSAGGAFNLVLAAGLDTQVRPRVPFGRSQVTARPAISATGSVTQSRGILVCFKPEHDAASWHAVPSRW